MRPHPIVPLRSRPSSAIAAIAASAARARVALGVLLVGALALLAGCSALVPKLETPQLSVLDVQVVEAHFQRQRFNIRMKVQNPNDRELPIRGLTYTMQIAGEDFGEGRSAKEFTVPALGEAEFDVELTTNLATSLLRILPRLQKDPSAVEYRLTGRVETDLGLLRSIPFTKTGTLSMK